MALLTWKSRSLEADRQGKLLSLCNRGIDGRRRRIFRGRGYRYQRQFASNKHGGSQSGRKYDELTPANLLASLQVPLSSLRLLAEPCALWLRNTTVVVCASKNCNLASLNSASVFCFFFSNFRILATKTSANDPKDFSFFLRRKGPSRHNVRKKILKCTHHSTYNW
jgi:hypothetical protein